MAAWWYIRGISALPAPQWAVHARIQSDECFFRPAGLSHFRNILPILTLCVLLLVK
jgi:hypothetical protein